MIQIALALLADGANISQEGKLNILGIFERISTQSVPATHPQMQLVMILEADRGDADKDHRMEIELLDEDGNKLFAIGGSLKFGAPPLSEQIKINHAIQLNNLQFEKFGTYEFKILINNEVCKSVPLIITRARQIENLRN